MANKGRSRLSWLASNTPAKWTKFWVRNIISGSAFAFLHSSTYQFAGGIYVVEVKHFSFSKLCQMVNRAGKGQHRSCSSSPMQVDALQGNALNSSKCSDGEWVRWLNWSCRKGTLTYVSTQQCSPFRILKHNPGKMCWSRERSNSTQCFGHTSRTVNVKIDGGLRKRRRSASKLKACTVPSVAMNGPVCGILAKTTRCSKISSLRGQNDEQ